jgi:hypothetical protein
MTTRQLKLMSLALRPPPAAHTQHRSSSIGPPASVLQHRSRTALAFIARGQPWRAPGDCHPLHSSVWTTSSSRSCAPRRYSLRTHRNRCQEQAEHDREIAVWSSSWITCPRSCAPAWRSRYLVSRHPPLQSTIPKATPKRHRFVLLLSRL